MSSRPMRCDDVLRRIDDHVDGLLPAEEAESVRDHLDACGDCRDTAFAAKAASTSLAVWGDLEPPAGCFDQILRRIDTLPPQALSRPPARATGPRRVWLRIVRASIPAAAAAAVVLAFLETEAPRERTRLAPHATYSALGTPASMRIPVRPRRVRTPADASPVQVIDGGALRFEHDPAGAELWIPR